MTPTDLRTAAGKADQFSRWARFSADTPRPEQLAKAKRELMEALEKI